MRKTATFCRIASYNYSLKVIRKEINYTVQPNIHINVTSNVTMLRLAKVFS